MALMRYLMVVISFTEETILASKHRVKRKIAMTRDDLMLFVAWLLVIACLGAADINQRRR